jgi:PQQ-dependent catabolism-associated CXXCW motif protein
MRLAILAVLCAMPLLLGAGVPEPEGFRMDNYNAPVPETIAGGRAVDAEALAAAMANGAIAIDVLAAPRKPAGMPEDRPWVPVPRRNISGSLWWPDVGRGAISPALDGWFRKRLAEVTGGDTGKAIAFYCKADCWMSWNAAKRAIGYGYRQVLWFPGGAEAWEAWGNKLIPATPEAVPVE